jgi:lipid-A-disaccharide synthase
MKLGIVAGEASGDNLGASLIKSLKENASLSVSGMGGPKMIQEGCTSLFEMEKLSLMGLIEPIRHLPELFKIRRELYQHFVKTKPDVFIGLDSPDFNLGLELKLRQAGIPIVHYVSPSVWAWRQKRIFKIKKSVDLMLTLFPYEADFYKKHNVPVCYVGHPLADLIPLENDKVEARRKLNIELHAKTIAILPGSRRNEIKYLSETFIKTAYECWKKNPEIKFITNAINETRDQEFKDHIKRIAPDLPIEFFIRRSHDVMCAADVVLVTSGTATLETMLFKRPMVVAYKMSWMTYQLAKYLVKISYMSLPNLLANESLVPEFIQDKANPEALSRELLNFLNHPEKIKQIEEKFLELHKQLRCDASQQAKMAVLELIK